MMEAPYHYQFRIIVIGDTMVGKSSLLKTFSEGSYGQMEPTVGVDFFSKLIEIKPKRHKTSSSDHRTRQQGRSSTLNNHVDENIIVKLQIWDTAGQERFKSIVTSYYRNSVGIVLVYDVTNRESYDHLINWFNEACRHVEPSSPTISPISAAPPKLINLNHHPLTSTPNATPNKTRPSEGGGKNSNRTNGNNIKPGDRVADCNGPDLNLPLANNVNCDNSSMSFNSLTSDLNNQQAEATKYKMAYLVIGCKTDLESQRQVSYEDGLLFANTHGFKFIETSSKMYYNVDQAFHLLAEEIYDKISESSRSNQLQRTPSGSHLTFVGTSSASYMNEGIRIGPLIENSIRNRYNERDRVRLLEAQPVSGFMGGCC